jgi:hypothetical protein
MVEVWIRLPQWWRGRHICSLLSLFWKMNADLCDLHAVCASPPINLSVINLIFIKTDMYIMALEPISTAYLMHPIYQSVCLYVYPPIVARQRLSKTLPRQRIRIRQKGNQSKSYFTTGGLSPISSSWCQASWGSRPEVYLFIYFATETLLS